MARGTDIEVYADEDDGDFVMSSCTECRRRMRANRLHHVTVEVQSGRRSGSSRSTYWGKRPSTRSGSSSSTYFKNVAKRMCDPCFDAYKRSRATAARVKLIGFGLVAAFFLFVYAKPSDHNSNTQGPTSLARLDDHLQAQINDRSSAVHYTDYPPASSSSPAMSEPPSTPPYARGFQALNSTPQPAEPTTPSAPPPEDYYRVNYLANVRSSPNNGPIVGEAQEGEELSVVEVKGSWARVRRGNDIIGWVHRKLLTPAR